jgi:Icc-related predicted phosphoesterase
VKILAISDIELPHMQNIPYLQREYADASLVISCGDLSVFYIEFITSVLNLPLFYVKGNHDTLYATHPPGGQDLHKQFVRYRGLWMAGLEGCARYNKAPLQYTQNEMLASVLSLAPGMLLRRAFWRHGVDLMVTHASPYGIHDRKDRPHIGFTAFLRLMQWYRPRYLIHGHVDIYDRLETTWTEYLDTQVVNINPVRLLMVELQQRRLLGRSL